MGYQVINPIEGRKVYGDNDSPYPCTIKEAEAHIANGGQCAFRSGLWNQPHIVENKYAKKWYEEDKGKWRFNTMCFNELKWADWDGVKTLELNIYNANDLY